MIRLAGPIGRREVTAVAGRASEGLIGCGPGIVTCDVGAVDGPALPAIEVLARLALAARRGRGEMRLEHASPAILELIDLCGLAQVLPCTTPGDQSAEGSAGGRGTSPGDSGGEVGR